MVITTTPTPPSSQPEFDQVLTGDVNIKKIHDNPENDYKITFRKKKISKTMLMYQCWSTSNYELNNNRTVKFIKTKDWVNIYFPNTSTKTFTPTTVMEIGNDKHVFVINDAKVNCRGEVVFYISSKYITISNANKKLKSLKKIYTGDFKNVRFDIDPTQDRTPICINKCQNDISNIPKYLACYRNCMGFN